MKAFFTSVQNFFIIIMTFISVVVFCNTPDRAEKYLITEPDTVRIMSFNIRSGEYEDRFRIVPQLIGDYLPDSVGIQECTYNWYLTIKAFLPEYGFVGVGRDTGDLSTGCGEISAVLYRKDKYEVVDSGTFWISETPEEVSFGWDAACRRICTWATLKNRETGDVYTHVNTHLDHEGPVARLYGSAMVRDFALTFDMPTVLTGDFNFRKNTDLYKGIVETELRDVQDIAALTDDGKTFHGYNGGEEGLPIDFIFVNNKISSVSEYRIIRDMYGNKYSSDHYPVFADIKLNTR